MKKRAVSNIEMILSFLLFIGFVFTALYLFTPADSTRLTDSSLNYAMDAISKNSSVEVVSYSIKLGQTIPGAAKTIAIDFPSELASPDEKYKVHAEDYYGNTIPAERNGATVYVDKKSDFIVLRFSEDFSETGGVSEKPAINTGYYQIASSSRRFVLSEKRVKELNNSYYTNYNALKGNLNIPAGTEFGFSLHYENGEIVANKNIPQGINVFAAAASRETLTLRSTNVLTYGEVSVQVW